MFLENVVIGSSVESAFYAFTTNSYYISTRRDPPMFYRDLTLPILGYHFEPEAWNRLNFILGLLGMRSSFDSYDSIRLEDNKIKISENNALYQYEFEKCMIFDTSGINLENAILEAKESSYIVLDDFEISGLGGKRQSLPSLYEDRSFVNQAHFYTSDRIDGASFISDCVAESILQKEQLYDFDYSDSMAKFVIQRYLESIGVYGTFMNFYKNGSPKYRKPTVKHVKRLVFEKDNNVYQDSDSVRFLNMTLEEIVDEASTEG